MANPNPGLPGRSPPRARGGCRRGVLIALLALFLCAIGSLVGYLLLPRGPSYTLPNVVIVEPGDGARLNIRPLWVLASASSPNKITKQELWVDGLLVYVTTPRDQQGQPEFAATLFWTPKPGQHTLIARATDGRGSIGASKAVRVTVAESAATEKPSVIQIAQPGDTIASIAKENAVTPDQIRQANPGLADPPPPGEWVNVPPNNRVPQGNDDRPGGVVTDPGPAPIPPDLPVGPGNPNPGFVPPNPLPDPSLLPPLAPDLFQPNVGNCAVTLTWRDNSNNEEDFYVYRLNPGGAGFSRIATIRLNNANMALSYTDRDISGDYQYYVAAHNRAGVSASRIVQVNIPNQNCWRNVIGQVLEVEAESLTISVPTEQAYCYASLKGHRPFERVPMDQNAYLRFMGPRVPRADFLIGEWNIAEYYAGANKRVTAPPEGGQPFRVEVECWAARVTNEGGESFSLGSFDQSHPPNEWDGRSLTGRGRDFTLVYHIRPWTGHSGAPNLPVDPDIPAPFGLRRARDFNDCVAHSPGDLGSRIACALINYQDMAPLVWEWNGVPEQIDGFRVYVNRSAVGGTFVPLQDVEKNLRLGVDPTQLLCGETWRYAVSAYNSAGNTVVAESPRSEFIALSAEECNDLALVEVELDSLKTGNLDDGVECDFPGIGCSVDTTMDTYGSAVFMFGKEPGVANVLPGDTQGVRLADSVVTVKIRSNHTIQWADLPLCRLVDDIGCLGWGRNQNKMVFLLRGGEWMWGNVLLIDSDGIGDDNWCYVQFDLPIMSLDEWAQLDRTIDKKWEGIDGDCFLRVRVRGLGRAGRSHVLPPGSGGQAMTTKNANLRVVNIERNRQGNARVTLYNAGPDTLIQDAATLQFQVARVESGAGGSPTTIWEHEERALLTIPAFGQTTLDTGQVLLEGFENRVRVVVTAVNFTDPDLHDNALCRRIDIPDLAHVTIRECAP